MTWIPFSEREPTDEEKAGGLWFGSHEEMRSLPWFRCDGNYAGTRHGYTHFCPVTPPTDLPPKPLPQLSEGSRRDHDATEPTVARRGLRFWLGGGYKYIIFETQDENLTIPLADIEALQEAGK